MNHLEEIEAALKPVKNCLRSNFLENEWRAYQNDVVKIENIVKDLRENYVITQGWVPVKGWELHYEVSQQGHIRKLTGEKVGTWFNQNGYELARLSSPRKVVRVHRVVAEAFIENKEKRPNVNHIDHNPKNNSAWNLEWCSQKENLEHMTKHGRRSSYWQGKRSPNAKLSENQVNKIISLRTSGLSLQKIADEVGTSKRTVLRIVNGESYAK